MIRFVNLDKSLIDTVLRIERACFKDEAWSRNMFESELKNDRSVFRVGLDENSNAVCYGCVWLIADIGEITNVAVAPEYRRCGFGESVVSSLVEICETCKMNVLNLEVKSNNKPAICLYEKLGFEIVGMRRGYYPDGSDALLMTKNL